MDDELILEDTHETLQICLFEADKLKHLGHQTTSDVPIRSTASRSALAVTLCSAAIRRAVASAGFLQMMADVSTGPLPVDLMTICGSIKPSPPIEICLASKATTHCLHDVTRICKEIDLARFAQRFQSGLQRPQFRPVGWSRRQGTRRQHATLLCNPAEQLQQRGCQPVHYPNWIRRSKSESF